MRVLIVSHGHPELSPGGGERAAYSLFQHLKTVEGCTPTFVSRADAQAIGHDGWFGAFRGRRDEFLWTPPPFDWFRCVSQQSDTLLQQVETIARRFEPDTVHFHHYYFIGLEAASMFKQVVDSRTVMTLHEYGLICNHNGQMVKRGSLRLCQASSPAECSACFPEITSGKFFLRERLIKQLLRGIDAFISPSLFLKDRYTAWGIDPSRISVIENLLRPDFKASAQAKVGSKPTSTKRKKGKVRFGYFGQINKYKGANVLLDALRYLPPDILNHVEVVLFGARLDEQPVEFREPLEKQIKEANATVSFFGPYRNEDVPDLLRRVDWMVIPSIWWENSPVVIQEAKATGTPILASNIGGMAEKVRDGIDGLQFLAGSAMDCASKIEAIVTGTTALRPEPADVGGENQASIQQHLSVYRERAPQSASRISPTSHVTT